MKAFALIALLLVSFSSAFAQQKIAIIDAGSSGSRLYVYEISKDGKSINTLFNAKKDLPLSNVHNDGVAIYIDSITSQYKTNETIPLYVLATAGMRNVDSIKASRIYSEMKGKTINKYNIKDAKTISGRYEGLYAWIALNYEYKKLGYSVSTPQKPLTYTSSSTLGIIEIGGASMQIAFATQPSDVYNKENLIDRKGFSRIYCKSYLGGGVDEIFKNNNSSYSDYIKELPKLDKTMEFYGLGTPIKIAVNNLTNCTLDKYISSLNNKETKFHPISNAKYITWLANSLGIKIEDIKIPQTDISWTKGAALDIVINHAAPESFNYNPNNPN